MSTHHGLLTAGVLAVFSWDVTGAVSAEKLTVAAEIDESQQLGAPLLGLFIEFLPADT